MFHFDTCSDTNNVVEGHGMHHLAESIKVNEVVKYLKPPLKLLLNHKIGLIAADPTNFRSTSALPVLAVVLKLIS